MVLVLAMLWTSTGTSNVMGVFAENLAGVQKADQSEADAENSTENDEETQEAKKTSKTESADSEEMQETTSKQKETKSATAKSKKRTVKSTEATTASKKDTGENSISTQAGAGSNAVVPQEESDSPTVTEVSLDDYINTSASGIWITINGQKETLEDIQKNNIKVPKESPVEIKLEYGAISNLTENTKLVYQIPNAITITEEKNDGEVTDGKIIAGTYSITKDGKVTITLNKEYLQDREGKIDGGTFIVEGNFKKDWGGTPGGDKIVFGKAEVTIPFEENQVVTKADLSLNKKVKKYNKDDNTITYQVTVKAPSDNTQDVPDVTVQDTFTTNGDKLILTDGKKYEIVTVPDGTAFDTSSGLWTVGTMHPGTSYTLEYKVKIDPTFFNELSDVKKGIKNKAIAYSGATEMKSDTATQTFQNNLNIEKSKGSGVIIDSETGKTYIDYTVTVTAPANNTNDMTNVVVDDVFGNAKEEVKFYSNIKATLNDGTTTTELKNSVNTTVNDATNTKSLKWTIGTMKPGSTATLTYRVELKDDVWERGSDWEINKNLVNTATVTADNMDKKNAAATVNLRKVWIWKSGAWNANKAWSNGRGTGLMKFTIHANESTGGGPVLDKNFTFTDELSGNYVYDGNVVVKVYQKGPDNKGNPIATDEFEVDGKTSWTYTPTGKMSGPYYYEFEYYARPKTNGHGGAVSNKAGIIGSDGSNFNHQTTWKGTGSDEYSLKKEYVGGVGVGAARWKTTIPSNVYAGTHYEDYLYYKYDSNTKVDSYHTFTQEQLDAIVVKLGTRTFIKGTDYNVTPILATINKVDKIIGFNLEFMTDTETVTKDNPITIEYASTPNLSGIATGKNRTFKNTGRIYYGNLYLTAKAETTYAQYADFSKAAGDYDAANKQLAWYLTMNENSKMSGNATITEKIPDGLKFVSAEISERGSEAAGTTIQVDESTKDSKNVKINVSGLVSNDHRNRNGYIKIKVITEVTDENFLQENTTKQFTNSAELAYGTDEKYTASAIANITNTALSKDAIHNSSTYPYVKYTIKVNPNGYNLLESKDTIDVVDSMTEHMILMEDSVEVSSNGKKLSSEEWSLRNDADNHRFILTVPDDKPLTITYQVSINKPTGEKIKLSNAAYYSGHEQAGKTDERTVTVMDSAATVKGSLLLYVKKKDSLTKNVLSGADFALAEVVRNADGSIAYENGEPKLSNTVDATTDKDGEATFKINQNTGSNKLYCLYEKKAPANYKKSEKKIYVAFKTQSNTGNLNIQYVQNGGSVEMENTPVGSLSVEKKVVGNQIPASDTESGYEMQVTAAESNADKDLTKATVTKAATGTTGSETITPDSATTEGTLTFHLKAGQKATVSGLPVGTYSVTENAANRADADKTAYTVAYSDGNTAVNVTQDAASKTIPEVTVTNTYKTELYVLKKDLAANTVLSGANLAIYKKADVSIDSNGMAEVKEDKKPVASWTSGARAEDLTGKVVAGESYVLVETKVPTSDYKQAVAIPFNVNAEGKIEVTGNKASAYDDATHTITLDNQKKTGSLTVKKIIEDGENGTAFNFTVTFANFNNGRGGKVTVTRKDASGKEQNTTETIASDNGVLKLEIKSLTNNEAVKISGIPYGTSYTVTETQQEGYLETENSGLTGVIGDNGTAANGTKRVVNAEASITNTRLTGFTVKKSVGYGQYTPDAETKDNKVFTFDVTLTRKGQPYTGNFKLQYSNESTAKEVKAASDGTYKIQLKDTQAATFSDLPSGTHYTVAEEADSSYNASVKVNGKEAGKNTEDTSADKEKAAATAEGTIDKTGDTIEFTNTRKLGAFSFTKTVKGNAQDKEQSYAFDVKVDGKAFNGTATITQTSSDKTTEKSDDVNAKDDGQSTGGNAGTTSVQITDGKISLKDGQTAVIENIPSGVSYSVKETTGDRYVTITDGNITAEKTGTIEEGTTSETQVVNQVIHLNVTKTDITGENEVAGATMQLYKAEDINEDGTVKEGAEALDSWTSGEDSDQDSYHDFGPVTRAGESYVLIETAAPAGYAYTKNIAFTVKEDGTIETEAEKTTNKETGEDIYLVKDEVTKVSITKTDITGSKELAGARLLLKDKEGKVIESWMSGTEAHVFEQKLIAGETYTLAEVTAPDGYEVAANITFTVNKDGTVQINGEAVENNEVIMKDEATPVGEEGKLVVSKLVTFQGKNQAVNRTFYVALFRDADCTEKVSNVKELRCEGAWSAYTVFEHLKDGTYYVAETDEDGNKLESSEACKIEGNGTKCEITPTQKTAYAVIENQLQIPGDDFLNTVHNLTVTKNVTLDGSPISDKYNGTFYVSLFTDPYYTNRTGDVKALQIQKGKSTSVTFTDLADGTYYVAETDKDGNPVENSDFDFDVSYDGDITVAFTEQDADAALGITNDMTERNPEYDKYLEEEDGGDDNNNNNNNTSHNSSSNQTKKSKNSKTGDNSHIIFYAVLAMAALMAAGTEIYRRSRKKNKHDR